MKVRIPENVPEDRADLYAEIYFNGFRHFQNAKQYSFEHCEDVRALFPEAYDAGQNDAFRAAGDS